MRDNISNMKFGHKIKQARNEAGLTQEQLGIKCGWSTGNPQSRIGNYEKDVRNPSATDIAIIANVLNKGILFFYDQAEDAPGIAESPGNYTQQSALSNEQIDMLEKVIITVERKFNDIDAKTKAKLIAEMFSNYSNLGLTAQDLTTANNASSKKTN
jgi:transcriptional regulator with XRE-family HTH domain